MKKNSSTELKDRVYILKGSSSPLTYVLPSRHTRRFPLLHFDGTSNRALRYASNQKSVFEDEQDQNPILEPVMFTDGVLNVPKTNPVLVKFLELHPLNSVTFEEFNPEKEAADEIEELDIELDAQLAARNLSIEQLEHVCRVVMGHAVDKMTTPELKRDVLIYARNNPKEFLSLVNDPALAVMSLASKALSEGIIVTKNNGRDLYYNLPNNKKKIASVPVNETAEGYLSYFMDIEEGRELLELVKLKLS